MDSPQDISADNLETFPMRIHLALILCLVLPLGGCSFGSGAADSGTDAPKKAGQEASQQVIAPPAAGQTPQQSGPAGKTLPPNQSAQQPAAAKAQTDKTGKTDSPEKSGAALCGPDIPPAPSSGQEAGATTGANNKDTWRDPTMPEKTSTTSPYNDKRPGNAPAPENQAQPAANTQTKAALPQEKKQDDSAAGLLPGKPGVSETEQAKTQKGAQTEQQAPAQQDAKDGQQANGNAAAQDDGQQKEQTDGLASEEDSTYRSPFSLYPSRGFSVKRGALSKETKLPSPDNMVVDAQACDFIAQQQPGKKGGDIEAIKKSLLEKARSDAAYLLFTRFYSGQTQLGLQGQLPLPYQEAVADRVQFKGDPTYYNGDVFGELCVRVQATLPPETFEVVSPVVATLENFCLQQGGLAEGALMGKATSVALDRIIQNLAPGAVPPPEFRQELLNEAKVNGRLGGPGNNTYCLNMRVEVSPLELSVYTPKPKTERSEQADIPDTLAANAHPDFSLDLSAFAPGDIVSKYGPNLTVYKDVNGKSLGTISQKAGLASIPVTAGQDFALRVLVQKASDYDFLHSESVQLFRLHFDNKAWEQATFVMSLDDNNNPVAKFVTRTSSSDTFPWTNAANFNDCYLVKQGNQIKFFFNGVFVLTYPTKGGALTEVLVPLQWNERLYNVIVTNP